MKVTVSSGQATGGVDVSVADKNCVLQRTHVYMMIYVYNLPAARENSWMLIKRTVCTCIAGANFFFFFLIKIKN